MRNIHVSLIILKDDDVTQFDLLDDGTEERQLDHTMDAIQKKFG